MSHYDDGNVATVTTYCGATLSPTKRYHNCRIICWNVGLTNANSYN